MEASSQASFTSLPKEIKQIIFSNFTDLREVIRIQATNREFRALVWKSITSLDFKPIVDSQYREGDILWRREVGGFKYVREILNERLNPAIVTELDLSGFYIKSVFTKHHVYLLKAFGNLRKLSFDNISSSLICTADMRYNLKKLAEVIITTVDTRASDSKFLEDIPSHIKIRNFALEHVEFVDRPNYHAIATDIAKLSTEEKIRFPSARQVVCGISYADKVIVGCEDGSISIFKYDNEANTLVEVATNFTLHSERINQITTSLGDNKIVIASSDGKVSVSDLNDEGLVPCYVLTFSEPIYMCDLVNNGNQTCVAAGKNTVYASVDGNIVKQRSFDSDITGVSIRGMNRTIATKKAYYCSANELHEIDRLKVVDRKDTPNIYLSPDWSLRATATQSEMALYILETNELLYSIPGRFAEGPNLLVYHPRAYWMTLSTGHSIATLNLEDKRYIMHFSSDLSNEDLRQSQGNYSTVRALWYEHEGAALFSLWSDNTIRWWKVALCTPIPEPNIQFGV